MLSCDKVTFFLPCINGKVLKTLNNGKKITNIYDEYMKIVLSLSKKHTNKYVKSNTSINKTNKTL